jgi:hypothetical protein
VGGKIENIVWDPTGTRVAVTYRSSSPTSIDGNDFTGCLVAIFSVAWEPFLIFTRRCVLLAFLSFSTCIITNPHDAVIFVVVFSVALQTLDFHVRSDLRQALSRVRF